MCIVDTMKSFHKELFQDNYELKYPSFLYYWQIKPSCFKHFNIFLMHAVIMLLDLVVERKIYIPIHNIPLEHTHM